MFVRKTVWLSDFKTVIEYYLSRLTAGLLTERNVILCCNEVLEVQSSRVVCHEMDIANGLKSTDKKSNVVLAKKLGKGL
jgi:hypothetical protein